MEYIPRAVSYTCIEWCANNRYIEFLFCFVCIRWVKTIGKREMCKVVIPANAVENSSSLSSSLFERLFELDGDSSSIQNDFWSRMTTVKRTMIRAHERIILLEYNSEMRGIESIYGVIVRNDTPFKIERSSEQLF